MPAGPTQTKSWFRGKNGWFTERYASRRAIESCTDCRYFREEKIIVNRVIREDPSKGTMHNRQPVTPKLLWQSLKDFDLWYVLLVSNTPKQL
jgi:hypothetical protein